MSATRFSAAGLLLLLAGCSPYPPGWTVHKHYSHNRVVGEHAAPDGGRWLGFRLGMTAKDASAALCRSVLDGDIAAGDAPVRVTDGRCVVIPDTRVAAGNWLITMPSLGCLPFRPTRRCSSTSAGRTKSGPARNCGTSGAPVRESISLDSAPALKSRYPGRT